MRDMYELINRPPPAVSYVVTLKPTLGGIDNIAALRAMLKFGKGRFGLQVISASEVPDNAPDAPATMTALLTGKTKK